jgi:cysteine synthase A
VEDAARKVAASRDAFLVDQFIRRENALAHEQGTAQEILQQTGGAFDAFCDFAGTGGSFTGCAKAFKKAADPIRCYLIEPAGAEVLAGKVAPYAEHPIQGGGYSRELPLIDKKFVDGFLSVTGADARHWARRLASEEGIFGGFSSGANVAAAAQLLAGEMAGGSIVTMICDSGLKYLSTDLWGKD